VADCHVGCNVKKLGEKKKKTLLQPCSDLFPFLWYQNFGKNKQKIGKFSLIYTRKTKISKIFPISLSKNGDIFPKTSTAIM